MLIIAALTLLGLVFGSFVNALVWRMRQQELLGNEPSARNTKRAVKQLTAADLSILKGRSMCPACHHTLAPKDLIPVVSFVVLKGKCRYCAAPIEDTPLVELITALLFAGSYLCWPLGFGGGGMFAFILWLVFLVGFMALALYDLRWFLLPDRIVFPFIGLAGVDVFVRAAVFGGGWTVLADAAVAAGCLAGLFYVLHALSRGTWIGFGDVKLAVVLGLLAGSPLQAVLLLFAASVLGMLAVMPLLVRGRAKARTQIPFGPFLLTATVMVVLFGTRITAWYTAVLYLR